MTPPHPEQTAEAEALARAIAAAIGKADCGLAAVALGFVIGRLMTGLRAGAGIAAANDFNRTISAATKATLELELRRAAECARGGALN